MTTFLRTTRKPLGIVLPLDEVKRRVICDARQVRRELPPRGAFIGHRGNNSLSDGEAVQLSATKGARNALVQHVPVGTLRRFSSTHPSFVRRPGKLRRILAITPPSWQSPCKCCLQL
jgi:hypothetical protein